MGRNRICELLGIKYPIIQAPMNWVSGADLGAAVSNAGGLGTLGPNSGAKDITSDVELTAERMRDQIRRVRSLTTVLFRDPFSLNVRQHSTKGDTNDGYYCWNFRKSEEAFV